MSGPTTKTPAFNVHRWQALGICLLLAAITFAVFGQTLRHGFVDYDDGDYVYENPAVARGLTLKGIVWAFTRAHSVNWHPLTWISHMLDCQVYGLHPGGHHLTSLLLHIAAVIALFLVLRRMTGALWRSAFVAAVFAVHPLRVESVAWVAERKDVLSGLFFMLTIGAYVRYACRPWSAVRYGLVALLFAMGLMCKPMLVTLPVVLLLLDYWPLQRKEPARRLILEKLPLLALSAASCVVTILTQQKAIHSGASFSLTFRLGNALASYVTYLGQMVWPSGLAVFYPYPRNGHAPVQLAFAGMLLAGLSALALWQWKKRPWMLMGWLWYLGMLLPVVGIIQAGAQAHADRYTYLPQIGIYLALTWLAAEWGAKWRLGSAALGTIMAGVIAALMVRASIQATYWRDSETLWNHTLACTTDNVEAYKDLGNTLLKEGKMDAAITEFQNALRINPAFAQAHNGLGLAFLQEHRLDEAAAEFQQALAANPAFPEAHMHLGLVFFQKGSLEEAKAEYQKALAANPAFAEAHLNLGLAFFQERRPDEAIAEFRRALSSRDDYAEAHYNLGTTFLQEGRLDDAIAEYQSALQINPDYLEAHLNLGNILAQRGSAEAALPHFQKALQLSPANPVILNSLAWLLATCPEASLRNGRKAVELAQQANALARGGNPMILRTLAAAFAEAGRFNDATQTAMKAIELARATGREDMLGKLNEEMKRYEAGLPFPGSAQTR